MAVGYSGLRSSVRYLGASSKAFLMNAACPAASSLGGGAVRFIHTLPVFRDVAFGAEEPEP